MSYMCMNPWFLASLLRPCGALVPSLLELFMLHPILTYTPLPTWHMLRPIHCCDPFFDDSLVALPFPLPLASSSHATFRLITALYRMVSILITSAQILRRSHNIWMAIAIFSSLDVSRSVKVQNTCCGPFHTFGNGIPTLVFFLW